MGARRMVWMLALVWAVGCDDGADSAADPSPGQQAMVDAAAPDAAALDAAALDAAAADAGALDAQVDLAVPDADIVAEQPRTAPAPRAYSGGTCPILRYGNTREAALNEGFPSGEDQRRFHLMVPENYDPAVPTPLVFGWHWLAGDSGDFVREGELDTAVDQMGFIVVSMDRALNDDGSSRYLFSWPFGEPWGQEPELMFFDDVLSCVDQQFNIDRQRVYGIGVSAGALWLTHMLSTDRADHFAAAEILSGGLGQRGTALQMAFTPRAHKFPALVLWGGPTDRLGIDFEDASLRLRQALRDDHHFVVSCTHSSGHGIPPITPPEGQTRFSMLWQFLLDHPYGLDPDTSPYRDAGALPDQFEDWCEIAE